MPTQARTAPKRATPKAGSYVTDEVALYRIEAMLPRRGGVILEDCQNRDSQGNYRLIPVTFDQFRAAQFRTVEI